MQEAEL